MYITQTIFGLVYDNFTIKWALKPANGTDLSVEDLPEKSDAEETVKEDAREKNGNIAIGIIVNSKPVTLTGKPSYIFVDVFDFIDFDLKNVQGKSVVTLIDGRNADFVEPLYEGAKIDIYWEK